MRDTGATEDRASNVLLLWQEPPKAGECPTYNEWEDFYVTIAKQRNRPAGIDVGIKFKRNIGRFMDGK